MQTHGRINEIVEFAEKKKAYETIITHYINGGLYNKAVEQLE
jgi:NDP-sugar pyrophosphorylase family protein